VTVVQIVVHGADLVASPRHDRENFFVLTPLLFESCSGALVFGMRLTGFFA